jgi:integrase/recombinase XerD
LKLNNAVTRYIDHKRALGMRFKTEGFILRALCRALGEVTMAQVRAEPVAMFLNGSDPSRVTSFWYKKHSVITGFYRYALARGLAQMSPLPRRTPRLTAPAFVPYIYSQHDLRRLLDAVPAACSSEKVTLHPEVFRALLLLLYGAGLRLEEALSLTIADVDLEEAVVCVRESKFYKTRLVPLGADLTFALAQYVSGRGCGFLDQPEAPFFRLRNGNRVTQSVARRTFRRVRALAGVQRRDRCRFQPRLHDLRHTAAVHRLVSWYRSGENLQPLLPRLATYFGHVNLAATQRYLTLTPELLNEASMRFERYALGTAREEQS